MGEECDDGNGASCDGCSASCETEVGFVCGDAVVNPACGEQCDDGGLLPGDGCDAVCKQEESVTQTLPGGGGSVTTDGEGDGTTGGDPVETVVFSPNGGDVSITETSQVSGAPSGFVALGVQVVIDAPIASVGDPLRLVFRLDASIIPAATDVGEIVVSESGVIVSDCTGAPSAVPDPCVFSRQLLVDGAIEIVVLASGTTSGFGESTGGAAALPLGGTTLWTFASPEILAPGSLGAACASNAECDSTFCVDGVCCESACDQPGEFCAGPGQPGICLGPAAAPVASLGGLLVLAAILVGVALRSLAVAATSRRPHPR